MLTNNTSAQEDTGPNLTQVTETGRKVLKYAIIGIVSYMVLSLVTRAFVSYWRAVNPPPPPPPTVGFGLLPTIEFPFEEAFDFPQEFEVSIPREKLNQFPDRAKIFEKPQASLSLLADERVRRIASGYGFDADPEMLGPNHYRWYKYHPLEYSFEIYLDNYNFSLLSDYQTRPELVSGVLPPEKHRAITAVKNYLSRAELLPADVATSAGEVRYLKSLAGQLVEAVSLSDASLIQVNLNRVPVDEIYPMFTPKQNRAIVSSILTNAVGGRNTIVQLTYDYHVVNYDRFETYPLKRVSDAIRELENGQAYVASDEEIESTVVRDVLLGYFDSFDYQPFLQPIYIFSGDNGFVAYVPAIPGDYYFNE